MHQRTAVDCGYYHIQAFREIISWEKDQEKNWSKRKQKPPTPPKTNPTEQKRLNRLQKTILINFEMSPRNKLILKKTFQQEVSINFI